jgi:cytochrome P450/NADPH-cytochrome P450 reductase
LLVQTGDAELSLAPGTGYLIGRDPQADIVVTDVRVSWQHAVLRVEDGHWVLADNGSTNGSYVGARRADRIEFDGAGQVRLGDPDDGPVLSCMVTETLRIGRSPDSDMVVSHLSVSSHHAELRTVPGGYRVIDLGSHNGTYVNEQRVADALLAEGDMVGFGDTTFQLTGRELRAADQVGEPQMPPAPEDGGTEDEAGTPGGEEPAEIPYAVRWLVPRGERFANFGILNDNDTQLDYYRRFGHIYAVGIPTRKWRLVVVSDPELLDEVAADEERFGKRVEEINFFAQLANSRGGGISVIGDGEHYERIRRVMLPWYSPQHQRTQLDRMKDQARKLVAAWSALPHDQTLDARAWMELYTLEVSGRGACAYDFGLLNGAADGAPHPHPFAAAVPASTKESIRRVADPRPDFTWFAGRTRRARRKAYRRHNAELVRTADALVRARMHTCPLGQQTDLLSRLVSTPDPATGELLDAETIRDQILMHLSNGFNGPSITAAWLVYVLATNPDVEARLIAEIDGITGGDPGYDLTYDDLMALTYTTQVIKETMRIYPPMPITIRRSLKDGTLGRYRIRQGDIILVGALAAQRDPRYWGPEPGRFDPGHFATDKLADRPPHAFIPFSIGRRQCMAQEVTFMMLRVVLFEIYRRYRLQLAQGTTVAKDTMVTTKPAAVPVIRIPREQNGRAVPGAAVPVAVTPVLAAAAPTSSASPSVATAPASQAVPDWGQPTEIPPDSAYHHLVVAYGSNFGSNKELAERFAERSAFYGYSTEVITLNELADAPPRTKPWLLVVMTSTYTSSPPSNAAAFKAQLERTRPGTATWRNCRYLVWGLGNSQWNAFLAFPRYVHARLAELGAAPLADLGHGDVGTPVWERLHADWNGRIWPILLELSGARPTAGAVERVAAENAAAGALTSTDSDTAMHRSLLGSLPGSLQGANDPTEPMSRPDSAALMLRRLAQESAAQSRVMLAPAILTNAAGVRTAEARVLACQDLLAAGSPRQVRQLDISLPPGLTYRAGDHLGVCPKNDPERVERLARHLGATLDGLFMAPRTMNVRAVPKGVVLQVRNVLTSLVDIGGRPSVPLLDLLAEKAADPAERSRLAEIRQILATPGGPDSPLRAAVDAGGYDVLGLLEQFPSCALNIFEFLRVAQPLRPRYYSVSSSPQIHADGVAQLTVALESGPVAARHQFRGLGSHYLHTLRKGDRLNVFLDRADGFRLQQDVTKPMIFVSAGTGLAPMRAFLWERLAMKRSGVALAEAALFNGIRSSRQDYIYRDEIGRFAAEGVLNHVHVAASREQPAAREHVQDRIRAQGALVWRLLQAGGYVYVCGAQPMRDAVRAAFTDVVTEHGAMPRERAEAYLDQLDTTARYRPDVWG